MKSQIIRVSREYVNIIETIAFLSFVVTARTVQRRDITNDFLPLCFVRYLLSMVMRVVNKWPVFRSMVNIIDCIAIPSTCNCRNILFN